MHLTCRFTPAHLYFTTTHTLFILWQNWSILQTENQGIPIKTYNLLSALQMRWFGQAGLEIYSTPDSLGPYGTWGVHEDSPLPLACGLASPSLSFSLDHHQVSLDQPLLAFAQQRSSQCLFIPAHIPAISIFYSWHMEKGVWLDRPWVRKFPWCASVTYA